jgi:hypothetical protein
METNGKASCGQRSRHIDIRYFFITDHSKRNNLRILHCPTNNMLADFFTKPLQGSLFRRFRSVLLGEAHIDTLRSPLPASSHTEERVGVQNDPSNPDSSLVGTSYHFTRKHSQQNQHTSHSIETYPEDN